jgi:hypothetical protein
VSITIKQMKVTSTPGLNGATVFELCCTCCCCTVWAILLLRAGYSDPSTVLKATDLIAVMDEALPVSCQPASLPACQAGLPRLDA